MTLLHKRQSSYLSPGRLSSLNRQFLKVKDFACLGTWQWHSVNVEWMDKMVDLRLKRILPGIERRGTQPFLSYTQVVVRFRWSLQNGLC